MMADIVASVSGDLWPKTRVVMGGCLYVIAICRVIGGEGRDVTGAMQGIETIVGLLYVSYKYYMYDKS